MNEAGKERSISALAVPFGKDELKALRADLLDMRKRHLGEPIGYRCENLRQLLNAYAEVDERRQAELEKNIRRQWADLIGLTGGMQ